MTKADYPCVCCGYLTMGEPPGSYNICPICWWEDDWVQTLDPRCGGGANSMSLIEAQRNFEQFGAKGQGNKYARLPGPNDQREPGWRLIDPDHDLVESEPMHSRGGATNPEEWSDSVRLYWWRPTYWRRNKTIYTAEVIDPTRVGSVSNLPAAKLRIAIVSDIHDNLTALQAVLADLRQTSPDLVLHGGDLVGGGSSSAEVVDLIRDLGWRGVFGNFDEAVARPETLEEFARQSSSRSLWDAVRDMTAFAREALGEERVAWLRALPRVVVCPPVALVHASPEDAWRSPLADAPDTEIESTYLRLVQQIAAYGHIHQPFVRNVMAGHTVVNTGSVSQSFDGDCRASYMLIDDGKPIVRRVEYDVEREVNAITAAGLPHADWVTRTLRTARPQMP